MSSQVQRLEFVHSLLCNCNREYHTDTHLLPLHSSTQSAHRNDGAPQITIFGMHRGGYDNGVARWCDLESSSLSKYFTIKPL